jgi:outer membrane receptor for ferrienterochelin and colicins
MTTLRNTAAAALAAILSWPAGVAADDISDLAGMLNEPVVSTASKSAETADLAPATTSVISADDLRRYGITSLDEAINFLGLGMLAEPGFATPEIGARGVLLSGDFGNHVLLLVDGHALNEPWDGTAYYDRSAAVPFDLVDHIEVILGPGSVLYGSSAMLGVINVITKRAKDYAGAHVLAEGAYPAAGRAAAGYGKQFDLMGREGEVVAGVDYYRSHGPGTSFGVQQLGVTTWGGDATHRSVEVPAGYLRLLLGDLQLSVRAASSQRAATQIWGTAGSFDDPNNWERDRWLSLDARWGTSLSPSFGVALRLYGDLYDYLENDPSTTACLDGQASCVYRNSGVSRWGGAELSGTWDWLKDGRYVTLVGVDVRYRHVTSWASFQDGTTGDSTVVAPYDESGSTLGAYVQQTLRPATWLSLNAGLRLDDDYQLGAHLSPRVAAVVPAWPGGTVKAIYSEAFRAPTFYERYYADGLSWIAAPDLKPETVRSIEGVVEQRLGANRLRVGLFQSWWNDLVLQVAATPEQIAAAQAAGTLPPGATEAQTYANASRVDSYGVNADWEGSGLHQRLRYGAGVTLAHSRQVSAGESTLLPAAAQAFGNVRASYQLGGRLPVLGLAARFVEPRPVSGSSDSPVPDAKRQVELRGAVTGPISGGLSYRLSAGWALTDSSAYAVGPDGRYLPLPRFQVLAGLRYDR